MKLFAERSYDEVSIDDIAEQAGISKGLLYHYYGSKRDFYVATVREAAAQLERRIAPNPALRLIKRAGAGIEGYLAWVEEHAGAYAALMRSGIGSDPAVASIVEDTRGRIVTTIIEHLGLEASRPAFRFALRSWVGLVEAASLDWIERRAVSRSAVVKLALESLRACVLIALRLDPTANLVLGDGDLLTAGKQPRALRARGR
jgi:AcrR family transcriptional regulator